MSMKESFLYDSEHTDVTRDCPTWAPRSTVTWCFFCRTSCWHAQDAWACLVAKGHNSWVS